MPELPDVEIYRQTADKARKRIIKNITLNDKSLDSTSESKLNELFNNKTITQALRRGKHLFLHTGDNATMVMHFGMTGVLTYTSQEDELPEYTKLQIHLDNSDQLNYISKRKLGFINTTPDVEKFAHDNEIGEDALEISKSQFIELLKSKKSMIKSALMDQSVISGIGNVYSDEILYQCGFHPKKKTTKLTDKDWDNLHNKMKEVMETAIENKARPSKLPDDFLTKHRKAGENCPKCKGEVKKIKISGRGMFFCPSCQQQ